MKKLLALAGAIAVTAVVVGGFAGLTASPARATSDCSTDGTEWDNGYLHNGIVANGNSFSADVENGGTIIVGNSSYENWADSFIGVSASNGAWLSAGILNDVSSVFMGTSFPTKLPTSGFQRYIAYDIPPAAPVLHLYSAAATGTYYPATITHVGTGDWTAQIGSSDKVSDIPISFSGTSIESLFYTNSLNTQAGTCNSLAFAEKNLSPWFITNPLVKVQSGPYTVTATGTDSFVVGG